MHDRDEFREELCDRLLTIAHFDTRPSAPPPSFVPTSERTSWSVDWAPGAVGRPYYVDRAPRTARARRSDPPWGDEQRTPLVASLPGHVRDHLSSEWLQDALHAHASIASFTRFCLELLAVNAPADLVRRAYQAAESGVRHAQARFALASAYRGEPLGPTEFPFEPAIAIERDLVRFAVDTFEAGCIGETLAALQANEQLRGATDPAVCAVLHEVARDEASHAELAFETVAWAIREGGAAVVDALGEVIGHASWVPDTSDALPRQVRQLMRAHGRLSPHEVHLVQVEGLRQVILPCARALLDQAPISLCAIEHIERRMGR